MEIRKPNRRGRIGLAARPSACVPGPREPDSQLLKRLPADTQLGALKNSFACGVSLARSGGKGRAILGVHTPPRQVVQLHPSTRCVLDKQKAHCAPVFFLPSTRRSMRNECSAMPHSKVNNAEHSYPSLHRRTGGQMRRRDQYKIRELKKKKNLSNTSRSKIEGSR